MIQSVNIVLSVDSCLLRRDTALLVLDVSKARGQSLSQRRSVTSKRAGILDDTAAP